MMAKICEVDAWLAEVWETCGWNPMASKVAQVKL